MDTVPAHVLPIHTCITFGRRLSPFMHYALCQRLDTKLFQITMYCAHRALNASGLVNWTGTRTAPIDLLFSPTFILAGCCHYTGLWLRDGQSLTGSTSSRACRLSSEDNYTRLFILSKLSWLQGSFNTTQDGHADIVKTPDYIIDHRRDHCRTKKGGVKEK